MIDTFNINSAITMTDDDFVEVANQGEAGPTIYVVEVGTDGWAIYGPAGVYENPAGDRIFTNLAGAHSLISGWGIKRFVQGKVVLVLP
ncbi:hypothetical protein [Xanthomonas arboricola]|uniref:hypothetical protein n=1 Tax=Xanthomonas arboricola TaxID=56448 RepID=UPI0011B04198|nr:hypothetical protein [Xanthomonas arboricola]